MSALANRGTRLSSYPVNVYEHFNTEPVSGRATMLMKKTVKAPTASKALLFLVAASSLAFQPGPGAVGLASAATLSIDLSGVCLAEVAACNTDGTCLACTLNLDDTGVIETTFDEDCATDYLDGPISADCSSFEANLCCSELFSDTSCSSSEELLAIIDCALEISECSIDDMPCLANSSGALATGRQRPLSGAKVVVTGTLGLMVTIATLIL